MTQKNYILHMASSRDWEDAQKYGAYRGNSLEKDGYIHFSKPDQLLNVANDPNNPFLGKSDLILVYVDPTKVRPEIKYEIPIGGSEAYPHLYGELNLDAVIKIIPFLHQANGIYILPQD